jgi:PEP-CTERM motif
MKMKQIQTKKFKTITLAVSLALAASAANADTYRFTQTGFNDGASVIGYFLGSDGNSDGKISGSEVTAFTATFFGGYYDGFSFDGLRTYKNLSYTVGSSFIGANSDDVLDIYARGISIGYFSNISGGQMYGFSSEPVLTSSQQAQVALITAVPEPETYAMMLAGLGMLGFLARRKKAA